MLDASLRKLVAKVVDVENSHLKNRDPEELYSRTWEFVLDDYDDWVILKISSGGSGGYWFHPVLCPAKKITPAFCDGLPDFGVRPQSGAYGHVTSGDRHWLEPYWEEGSGFDKSEVPLFFGRHHYGRPGGKENYIEFNQLVTHPLNLHWSHGKQAYCSVNSMGDEVEKIKIVDWQSTQLVVMKRRALDKLLYLGNWVLVRYFMFTRRVSDGYYLLTGEPTVESQVVEFGESEGRYKITTTKQAEIESVEFRGGQIERPITPEAELLSWGFDDDDDEDQQHASFIIQDIKNGRVLEEYSLDPSNFSDNFTKSNLPFEISPIFFNAEVLDRYRNNPDKYDLDERRISCRGGWLLETYDINEYNQVHTYAIYLSRLPYREQLHWKIHNEKPNGEISKRAYQTDFKAEFPDEEPKLSLLKQALESFGAIGSPENAKPLWSPKGGSWEVASKGLFYVTTENPNQWHDFVIALSNATIEGFQTKRLKDIAASFGNDDEKLRTLGLIKFIVAASGNEAQLGFTHKVLSDLHDCRGRGKAHGNWKRPDGSLVEDADKRLDEIIIAIEELTDIFAGLWGTR